MWHLSTEKVNNYLASLMQLMFEKSNESFLINFFLIIIKTFVHETQILPETF